MLIDTQAVVPFNGHFIVIDNRQFYRYIYTHHHYQPKADTFVYKIVQKKHCLIKESLFFYYFKQLCIILIVDNFSLHAFFSLYR